MVAKLTPEQGNRNHRAPDHEIAAMSKRSEFAGLRREQSMAKALDRLICGTSRTTRGMAPAEVSALIDVQTLVDGRHDDTVCEYSDGTAIPADTA